MEGATAKYVFEVESDYVAAIMSKAITWVISIVGSSQ